MMFLRLRGMAIIMGMALVIALLIGVIIYQFVDGRIHLATYEGLTDRYQRLEDEVLEAVDTNLDRVISQYIINRVFVGFQPADKKFEAHRILGAEQNKEGINLYLYIRHDGYSYRNSSFERVCGGAYPLLMQVKKNNGSYKVAGHKMARDGDEYADSLKELFPEVIADKALYGSNDVKKELEEDLKAQAEAWMEGNVSARLDTMKVMQRMFPKLRFNKQGSLFSAGERQNYFIDCILPGAYTSKDACEMLVLVKRPTFELSHVEGFYQVYAAVFDCFDGKMKSDVKLFSADEGDYHVLRGKNADYLLFAGNTTYQGWTEWTGGVWRAGAKWRKLWPIEDEYWKDKAVKITDNGLSVYKRKIKEGTAGVIPNYTWEFSHSLLWDGDKEEFVGSN